MEKDEIKDYIKDTVYMAIQSNKQENSGLIAHLEDILKRNENGMQELHTKADSIVKWQTDATPSINIIKSMQGFWSVSGTIFKAIVLMSAVATAVYGAYKFIIFLIKNQ